MKPLAKTGYKYESVRKRVIEYEKALTKQKKSQSKGQESQIKQYVGQPEPVTRASVRKKTHTTFEAGIQRKPKPKQRPIQPVNLIEEFDIEGLNFAQWVPFILVFVSIVCVFTEAPTIITTYNILPITLNVSGTGVIFWMLILLWVVTHLLNLAGCYQSRPAASVNKGTQTGNERLPVQATNHPTPCTENFLGDPMGIVHPESDQGISTEIQYLALHKETQV